MKKILVLGGGCPKCKELAARAEQAAAELGIEVELNKVTDLNEIMTFGVMITPGLVIDGEVKASGKVPSVEDIKAMLGTSSDACCDGGDCGCGVRRDDGKDCCENGEKPCDDPCGCC